MNRSDVLTVLGIIVTIVLLFDLTLRLLKALVSG